MTNTRRDFIRAGALGAAVAAAGVPAVGTAGDAPKKRQKHKSLDILVLGGTGFIGPHMVREALRRGHSVTLFNRGRSNSALFPDLETIKGDRDGGLDGLRGRQWDAVIDNSGYVPRHVQDSARLLAPNVGRYLFVSTVSVYADIFGAADEDAPLATLEDESVEEVSGQTYGALKAYCEKRVMAEIDEENRTIVRPTYICGPGDHTDRFSYWPVRTRKGGEMLWPGELGDVLRIVDVRDLANFTIDCLDRDISGTFNASNPPESYTMGRLLEDCLAVTAADVDPVWVPQDFLTENGLQGGSRELPVWHGAANAMKFSTDRALAAGMHNRPERETARDLLAWWDTLPEDRRASPKAGMPADREAAIIAAWKARGT